MEEATDLAAVLGRFVKRSGYNVGQLGRLADIPKRTIANWLGGHVSRPRHGRDLLKLATVLHLDERETSELLVAAGHPSLPHLLAAAGDEDTRDLLAQSLARRREVAPFQAIPDLPYFVGREQEVRALQEVLLGGGRALICSLQGMGGVGKTALAAHLAYRLRPYFHDGVLWARVDQSDPMSILSAFAHAYGRDVSPYADLESRSQVVREILAGKRALIVLDNVQDSEEVRLLLPPSIGTCAVLITTRRQTLAVTSGAHRFTVGPFDETTEDAIELFARILGEERARRQTHTLRHIAILLGHLPLAVAIAASRMAYEPGWSASQFLKQLQQQKQRLDVLTYENQSVRLSANLSYDLLPPEEQRFFAVLGVFSSENLNLQAIAHVTERPLEVVQAALRQLYALSLVQVGQGGRYRLHPLLHDYARERLWFSEEREAAPARMIDFFVSYVDSHRQNYEALEREIDHILAALEAAFSAEMLPDLIRIANGLYFFLETRGLYDLAAVHLERAREAARSLDDSMSLAAVLLNLAHLHRIRGDYAVARLNAEEGLALARRSEDEVLISALLGELSAVLAFMGHLSEANRHNEEGLILARQLENAELMSTHLLYLGVRASVRRNYAKAEMHYEEGLALARQTGDARKVAKFLNNLGSVASNQGMLTRAEDYYQKSLVQAQELGYQELIGVALNSLGKVRRKRGEYREAEAYHEEALTLARRLDQKALIRLSLEQFGEVASAQELYEEAESFYRQLLALARETGGTVASSDALLMLGRVLTKRGAEAEVETCFVESLMLARQATNDVAQAYLLNEWGDLLWQAGNLKAATTAFTEALALARAGNGEKQAAAAKDGLARLGVRN